MSLPALSEERNALRVQVSGNTVRLEGVLGEVDVRNWLFPFLQLVHQQAVASSMPEVVFDIRRLSYASAGVWRSLLLWLRLLRSERGAPYSVRLLSDPAYRWQKMGVPAIVPFGADRLVVR
jgi:hypothetical protein